ncbi:lactoylglutathione lyase [Psychrosphaera sp. B3R10]|uniref:lactoylglutathione lyase n=1 Tax=unclassified Psychrosphaera TaxID=2641570 RepID=UPI001C09AED6|nr:MULTISPECIES: lactoylglutathione lyase [unclassified Psychrosphaera]MBU2883108.1 lactoylglutathione lyase [Psychrosphaera sp. I2R16]MBU2988564.1 lactoylglutathione lyase [Psychrosphaera sp. B3R10]
MKVDDIRVFIPSKDYQVSQTFYQAMGFKMEFVTDDLSLFTNGDCTFFLTRLYNKEFATNLMFQLAVLDIDEAFETISALQSNCLKEGIELDIKYEPIKTEHWGKVVYLWGPSGELWHVTQFAL